MESMVDDGEDDDGGEEEHILHIPWIHGATRSHLENTDRERQGKTKLFDMFVNLPRCPLVFDIPRVTPVSINSLLAHYRRRVGLEAWESHLLRVFEPLTFMAPWSATKSHPSCARCHHLLLNTHQSHFCFVIKLNFAILWNCDCKHVLPLWS